MILSVLPVSSIPLGMIMNRHDWTHHLFPQEAEAIQRPQGLCGCLYVTVDNMRLSPHAAGLKRDNVENRPIRHEQHVQRRPQILLLDFG